MSIKTDAMFRLVYPERRIVTTSWIMLKHSDAVANGTVGRSTTNVLEAIRDLEDLGHITVEQSA